MNISIQHLVPFPLKEKIATTKSEIWNTSLEFKQGQLVKIIAPSGTGKTTFIHQLYNLRTDYSGTIMYDNVSAAELSQEKMATIRQEKMSVVFQDLRLFEQLTAWENLQLKKGLFDPFVTDAELQNMIEVLGITHIMQQPTYTCSYGEQQRLAIIRALIQPFEVLLLDEPFSHLDNANTSKAVSLIEDAVAKRQACCILTDLEPDTHFNYTHQYYL